MKKLLLLFLLSPLFVHAQSWQWAHSAGNNGNFNYPQGIAFDAHGNVYMAGVFLAANIVFGTDTLFNPAPGSSYSIFLVKYDVAGNLLWAKSTGTGGILANELATDAAGNVYMTGSFRSDKIYFGNDSLTNDSVANQQSIFVVKYDSLGNEVWAKGAPSSVATITAAIGICTDPLGGIYITGYFQPEATSGWIVFGTDTLRTPFNFGGGDLFVTKYDTAGNVVWARQNNYGTQAVPASVAADGSGNVYAVGSFTDSSLVFGSDTLFNPTAISRPYFMKYDASGNFQWAKTDGTGDACSMNYVTTDPSGNAVVCGAFNATMVLGTDTLTDYLSVDSTNWFVAMYSPSGNTVWAKNYGEMSYGYYAASDGAGNIYLAGQVLDAHIDTGVYNFAVAKYSPVGNLLWITEGSEGYGSPYGIIADAAGSNVYVAGIYTPSLTLGDITLYCKDSLADQNVFLARLGVPYTGVPIEKTAPQNISVYPNPAGAELNILSDNEPIDKVSISNMLGQSLQSAVCSGQSRVSVDISSLAAGVYFVRVSSGSAQDGSHTEVRKFVKE